MTVPEPPPGPRWPRLAGIIAQGLVLGPLLLIAFIKLISVAGDLTPFRYQGF
jgi:hypothetical protein